MDKDLISFPCRSQVDEVTGDDGEIVTIFKHEFGQDKAPTGMDIWESGYSVKVNLIKKCRIENSRRDLIFFKAVRLIGDLLLVHMTTPNLLYFKRIDSTSKGLVKVKVLAGLKLCALNDIGFLFGFWNYDDRDYEVEARRQRITLSLQQSDLSVNI